MALGAALASALFAHWGWMAVSALASGAAVLALLVRWMPEGGATQPS
jgi:threonine/homoserine efflux transporter RhtA